MTLSTVPSAKYDVPNFGTWSRYTLEQFAAEYYVRVQEMYDEMQTLRSLLKSANTALNMVADQSTRLLELETALDQTRSDLRAAMALLRSKRAMEDDWK